MISFKRVGPFYMKSCLKNKNSGNIMSSKTWFLIMLIYEITFANMIFVITIGSYIVLKP